MINFFHSESSCFLRRPRKSDDIFTVDLTYTECPTNMLTTSDSIFYFLKPDMSKSKTCFEILVKKAFRWHLETWENQIGSIFKLNIKKKCQIWKMVLHPATSAENASCTPTPWQKKCFCTLPPQLKTQYYHILSNFNTMEKRIL